MNYLAQAGTEALAGSVLGNRIIRYAFDAKPNLNKNDAIAIATGTLTPVIASEIFKKSLRSITGFHGISGCIIAGILTYLLNKEKGKNTMENCLKKPYTYVSNFVSNKYTSVSNFAYNNYSYLRNNNNYQAIEKQETVNQHKVIKKGIANEAVIQLKKMHEESNKITEKYTKEIDKHIPLIKETIDKLLDDCSPENIIPLTQKTVHILSKLKEKKGSELEKSFTEINNNALKPLYELQDSLQELHEIIDECNSINGYHSGLFFQEDRNSNKADSHEMSKKIEKIRDISKKSLSIADNPKNELQPISKDITRLVTEHAEQIYATGLLKNVNHIVSDIASSELLETPRVKSLQTIMTELSVPELEKFREFSYNTLDLKETIGLDIRGKSLNLNELEEKVKKRLSDTVIEALNQSKTPRGKAEKELYHILREVKLHDVEHWRASRNKIGAKKDNFKKVKETFYMADETLNLEELKALYPQPINKSKAEAELDELRYVTDNNIDSTDEDPKIKALEERFKKL